MSDVALVHDYLIPMGGAERVVATFHHIWPNAPLYTSAVDRPGLLPDLAAADIRVSWMQKLPGMRRDFRRYFPLYPLAFQSFPAIDTAVALISASTFAKCIRVAPYTRTVCYCYSPTRFLWRDSEYILGSMRSRMARAMVRLISPWLRRVDFRAAQRMNVMVTSSEFIRAMIQNIYRRDAIIVHPPVNIDRFEVSRNEGVFYLIASRLVGYKGIELAITACERLGRKLIIIGDGPERANLERLAGSSTRFLGRVAEDVLRRHLQECRAFIFPGVEDFGIAPIEAQACGKPVIALAQGGALETIVADETGVFFHEASADALERAILRAEGRTWNADIIHRNALRFSVPRFETQMRALVEAQMGESEVTEGRMARVIRSPNDPIN